MQKKKSARHLNKVAELAAALLLSASPLAGTFQSAAFVQAASQETVSPRSASRAALTKYLQQEQRYNAKESYSKFQEAAKEQRQASGQAVSKKNESSVRVIVSLNKSAAFDHTSKPTGSAASVKKIEQASDQVKDGQEKVIKQVEEITGNKVRRQFGYLVNAFSIDMDLDDIDKVKDLPQVKNVTPVKVYHPTDESADQIAQVQDVWQEQKLKGEGMVISIIDTGIDSSHQDLKLDSGVSTALSKSEVESDKSKLGHGKYYTEKVPYGYNYADKNDQIVDNGSGEMHGQHVAGIAGANGQVKGVAPDAQLLAMKVFSNNAKNSGAYDDDIISAIEDSVKLGANVINMSLGSVSSDVDPSDPQQQAVAKASEAGVINVISAGNSGVAGSIADGNPVNNTGTSELSTVGAPGVTPDALTVASAENSKVTTDTVKDELGGVTFSSNSELKGAAQVTTQLESNYSVLTKKLKLVDMGLGGADDYTAEKKAEVKGQLAVVKRGSYTFSEKVANAKAAGAAGIVIYNNNDDGLLSMALDDKTFPTLGMSKADGEVLAQAAKDGKSIKLKFGTALIDNSSAGKMSDFTSWGPTPELDFKPEITAPGGKIYSLANDNKYQQMSGTSMASPFVAGSEALILQGIKKQGLNLSGEELVQFAKNSAMNTSHPVYDTEHTKEIISPRRQGSGEINVKDAINNTVEVKAANGNGAAALKEIGRQTTFKVTLTNHGKKAQTYAVDNYGGPYTQATEAKSGEIYDTKIVKGQLTTETPKVTVQPGESVDVSFTLTLPYSFQRQNFVEGYVGFEAEDRATPNLVLPYMGFFGSYSQASVSAPMLYEGGNSNLINTIHSLVGVMSSNDNDILGYTGGDDYSKYTDPDLIAISPNGDGSRDYAYPVLFFDRNYKEYTETITDAQGNKVKSLGVGKEGTKDYYSSSSGKWTTHSLDKWDGTDADGQVVKDGQYIYKVEFTPATGGSKQELNIPVKVDTQAPEVSDLQVTKDGKLRLKAKDSGSGLDMTMFVAAVNGEKQKLALAPVKGESDVYESTTALTGLKDGKNQVETVLADYAGNVGYAATFSSQNNDADNKLLLFNLADGQKITSQSPAYDQEKETYTVTGTYKKNAKLKFNDVEAESDEDGYFEVKLPVKDGQNLLLIKDGDQTLEAVNFTVKAEGPKVSVDEESSGRILAKDDSYTLSGTVSGLGESGKLELTNLSDKSKTKLTVDQDGKFSQKVDLNYGDNPFELTATDADGNVTKKDVTIFTARSYTYTKDMLTFDNIASDLTIIGKTTPGYDEKDHSFTVTGKLAYPVARFQLNGDDVKYDPDTLKFSYTIKDLKNGNHPLTALVQDPRLNDGKPVVEWGYKLWVDLTAPSLQLEGMSLGEDGQLAVYTNKDVYDLKATINDNLSGYSLQVGSDTAYQDKTYEVFNEDFFKNRDAVKVSYPIKAEKDGSRKVKVTLTDSSDNKTEQDFTLYNHQADLEAPEVSASESKKTNQAVQLKVENLSDVQKSAGKFKAADLYYSVDGKTWTKLDKDTVQVAENGKVEFKYQDVYGNESKVTTYEVKNIVKEVAAQPELKLTPDGEGKVKAELAFDKKDVDQDFNHIKYSLDGGKTWTDYKDAFTLTHNGTVEFKSYDDAGNESQVYTSVVKVERKLPAPDLTGTVEADKSVEVKAGNVEQAEKDADGKVTLLYSTDGKDWSKVDGEVKLTDSDRAMFKYRDGDDNESAVVVYEVKKVVEEKTAESKPENKDDSKSDSNTDTKSDTKSDSKSDSKSDNKAETKSDVKTDSKTTSKSSAKKTSAKKNKKASKKTVKKTKTYKKVKLTKLTKVYNKKGKVVGKLKKTSVKLLSKKQKLHGKYYYRVGKNRYILASSLPKKTKKVKQVRVRKNAKAYNKKGKVVGHLKKKQKVKLLSKKQKLHGKYYYRIGKNRYVKANVL
ncbi:S8 family serine peptidase [Lactobacillus delbrueckii]|uniref:S8 family serine peptidase n=1 Tax=Lactobacillus delbrueckii TaxID=1584 RepID=UPI0004AC3330|nr:S8 family serine peptidase [Lactobacillus delbrueckii]MCD5436160.1 S8 family serine peptidase [Lactobacillus delbrueckii subsp. lactis]MCD5516597.1 S8 family serine peptidase [Lactobacillus delbrueckii subsp. lactis]MCD5522469.1 S8 family serine peptidase [Lactobacillus delbrueckii subsp. lactis]MCT3484904.1 peptidase S8 [Lactobacillus delbrueckii subsp. lactis]MCT3489076.1 peptidase S8 [Lactobacillus delbrueckii subsp. lactis]